MTDCKKVSYRSAGINDYKLIIDLENQCFAEMDRFVSGSIKRYLINPANSILTDIIEVDGRPVGYAVYFTRKNSKTIRLYSFCISPAFSGKGYGQSYLKKRISTFHNYDKVSLEVRVNNLRAQAVYKKLGFQIVKTLPAYYSDGENGYRMVKFITPRATSHGPY